MGNTTGALAARRACPEGAEAFRGFRRSYGMFGREQLFRDGGRRADLCLREKVGYWGRIVLRPPGSGSAPAAGGTFDRAACPAARSPTRSCLRITVGHVSASLAEGAVHLPDGPPSTKPLRRSTTRAGDAARLVRGGMRAVCARPALNRQPSALSAGRRGQRVGLDYALRRSTSASRSCISRSARAGKLEAGSGAYLRGGRRGRMLRIHAQTGRQALTT
ncbi:MAG: hypothetical protein ACLVL7_12325 [Anaerotruncus massiliensis (ex Togo et al. 2019)]